MCRKAKVSLIELAYGRLVYESLCHGLNVLRMFLCYYSLSDKSDGSLSTPPTINGLPNVFDIIKFLFLSSVMSPTLDANIMTDKPCPSPFLFSLAFLYLSMLSHSLVFMFVCLSPVESRDPHVNS